MATSLKNPAGKTPLAQQKKGSFNLWEIRNGGGGWVHPFHLHMEEHRTVMRNGKDVTVQADAGHPDDVSREDLVALDPGESVIIYRGFRDFVGPVRGALPQPGPRGPRHDVRLGDHPLIQDRQRRAPTGRTATGTGPTRDETDRHVHQRDHGAPRRPAGPAELSRG